MTKEKAIEKVLRDLGMPMSCEDYVLQTMGRLGCDDIVDIETVNAIELVIKRELGR